MLQDDACEAGGAKDWDLFRGDTYSWGVGAGRETSQGVRREKVKEIREPWSTLGSEA